MDRGWPHPALHIAHTTVVTSIQRVCQTNERAELANALAVGSVQHCKLRMTFFGQRAAVIPGDISDDRAFDFGEPRELGI